MTLAIPIIIIAILAWVACAKFAYLGAFTYYQRNYLLIAEKSRNRDARFAFRISLLLGPFTLLTGLLVLKFYRHGFRVPSIEEVRRLKRAKFPQYAEIFDREEAKA